MISRIGNLIIVVTLAFSCGTNNQEKITDENSVTAETSDTNSGVLFDYMALKQALVESDTSGTKAAGDAFAISISEEKMGAELVSQANLIASSDDIEEQREAFMALTDAMITYVKENSINKTVYVQYCPMAFDNSGASWLSLSEEIENPYFGDYMLACGEVTERF